MERRFPTTSRSSKGGPAGRSYFTGIMRDLTQRRDEERARIKLAEQLRQSQTMEGDRKLTGGIRDDFNNSAAGDQASISRRSRMNSPRTSEPSAHRRERCSRPNPRPISQGGARGPGPAP